MSWVKKSSEKDQWAQVNALMNHFISQDQNFGWEIVFLSMGGGDEEKPTTDYRGWLKENVEPAEILGYLKREFGKLPMIEPGITEEEFGKLSDRETYSEESRDKLRNLEWAEIADMPALPLHDNEGYPLENPYQMTEQEKRTGISLRKIANGSFGARDNYGWGMHAYGSTPHEALAKLYELLTGKIPYASSGDI